MDRSHAQKIAQSQFFDVNLHTKAMCKENGRSIVEWMWEDAEKPLVSQVVEHKGCMHLGVNLTPKRLLYLSIIVHAKMHFLM